MKKIFYLTVILLAFIGCTDNCTTSSTSMIIEHVDIIYVKGYDDIRIFELEYNGHDYLIFDGYESMGVEHSPDCKKCKSQTGYTPTEYLY